MKEALEMVKAQLGPDAIILSARDNKKSFGLLGEGSVEITAAASEETLRKKRIVEEKLREEERQQFLRSPARVQKQVIEKFASAELKKNQPRRPITTKKYIEIDEGDEAVDSTTEKQNTDYGSNSAFAVARIKSAAKRAFEALAEEENSISSVEERETKLQKPVSQSSEVMALREEIATLKDIISRFQNVPQVLSATHPGGEYGIPYDLSWLFEKLTCSSVSESLAAEILTEAADRIPALKLKNKGLVEGWVAQKILNIISIAPPELTENRIHLFVGGGGSGKTSTLVKMASHIVVREKKKVAIITTDTLKVGAVEQMRIYAQILNVPFGVIRSPKDWMGLMRYFADIDVVLVDFPGLGLRSQEEIEKLRSLLPPGSLSARTHLTLSAISKNSDIAELARRYKVIGYQDAVFTALDASAQHGHILNFNVETKVPLYAYGIGPRVPEDFEFATRERVLDLILKLSQRQEKEISP